MRNGLSVLLVSSIMLMACEQITGDSPEKALEAKLNDPKYQDAKATGYACRVSKKLPEDCMKENDAHSPSSILDGWKEADKDIHEKLIDPRMSAPPFVYTASAPVASSAPIPATKAASSKDTSSKKTK